MKHFIFAVLFCGLCTVASAGKYKPTVDDVNTFLKNTTYVVLESNPLSSYNFKIKEVIEQNWTLTKYEFITTKEFEQMRKEQDKSFLVLVGYKYPEENISVVYNHLSAVNGSATSKITDMPEIISVPLAYAKVDDVNYSYKIEGIVRFMQQHILALKADPQLMKADMLSPYSDNAPKIKDKELWLTETDLVKELRSISAQRKYYPYVIRVVTPEDIEKAIAEKKDNVLFVHKVGPEGQRMQERVYKMIFSANDGMLYYYNMHNVSNSKGDGFLDSDLKKIAKK